MALQQQGSPAHVVEKLEHGISNFLIGVVDHNLSRFCCLRRSLQPDLPERRVHKCMQRGLQKAFSQRLENTASYRSALILALHCHEAPEKTNWLKHSVQLLPAMSMQGLVTFGRPDHNLSRFCRLRQSLQPDLPERRARKCMQRALQKAFSQRLENTANYRSALILAPHCHQAP